MKTITRQQYLMALGLFTVAQTKQRQVVEMENELNGLLGLGEGSHVSDEIYDRNGNLDDALEREDIKVEEPVRE